MAGLNIELPVIQFQEVVENFNDLRGKHVTMRQKTYLQTDIS